MQKIHRFVLGTVLAVAAPTAPGAMLSGTDAAPLGITVEFRSGAALWSVPLAPAPLTAGTIDFVATPGQHFTGTSSLGGLNLIVDIAVQAGAFVTVSFQVENTSSTFRPFGILATVTSGPISGPTSITGSVSGFVSDGNGALDPLGNGATVRTNGTDPYYAALIDGVVVRSLYPDPQLHTAPLGLTQSIPTLSFIGEVGPSVVSTIGIQSTFELSPGDNAGFTSTFMIVPGPGSVALFLLGSVVAMRRRR